MEILGYIASLFIGVSFGMIGAGGSILTVPVLVYLFGVPVMKATSYSLFIVGVTSLLGACYQYREGNIKGRLALLFSLVSLSIVFLVRHFVMPVIPSQLFTLWGVAIKTAFISMILFSLLMILAARGMLSSRVNEINLPTRKHTIDLILTAFIVGFVTGFLGAGGGFILIPAFVLVLNIPMKRAIGTSLFIIAINSLVGFGLDIQHATIDWSFLGTMTLLAVAGILLGASFAKQASPGKLRYSFGCFVMLIGVVIFLKEMGAFIMKLQASRHLACINKIY